MGSETERNFGYGGQGFHNIRAGDVDFDGRDEIIYGHMAVDHDGRGLWTTGYGHGDAMHVFQTSPESRGLVNWTCHEHWPFGVSRIDCETGRTLLRRTDWNDTGSCNAMDAGVASQNSGYNVPTSPGFYFGPDLKGHGISFCGTYLP